MLASLTSDSANFTHLALVASVKSALPPLRAARTSPLTQWDQHGHFKTTPDGLLFYKKNTKKERKKMSVSLNLCNIKIKNISPNQHAAVLTTWAGRRGSNWPAVYLRMPFKLL